MRILIVEDDRESAGYVIKGLRESGHVADHAANGLLGYEQATNDAYDVMVVDRMLPGMDGIALVQQLRRDGNTAPVLFLSALGEVDDRVKGLRAGGDDYLAKPYAFAELLARIEGLARRGTSGGQETTLTVADLEMDLLARQVTRHGQ